MNELNGIALLLLGLMIGLFGYGAFRLVVLIVGLIWGLWAGLEASLVFEAPWAAIGLPVAGALLGVLALGSSVALALFGFGAAAGIVLLTYSASLAGITLASTHPAVWAAAAAGGVVALIYRRPLIVVGTAICGAALVVRALFVLWAGPEATAIASAQRQWAEWTVEPGVLSALGVWIFGLAALLLVFLFSIAQGAAYRRLPTTSISGARYEKKGA